MLRLPRALIQAFHPASVPFIARANYSRELLAAWFMPFLIVSMEGAIIGVLVKNGYSGIVPDTTLNYIVAAAAAAPAFANVLSFVWVRLSHGRPKIGFVLNVQIAVVLLVMSIALTPRTAAGLWILTVLVVAARVCAAGLVTLRSTIWQQNYPQAVRARVTSKFMMIQVLLVGTLGTGLGIAMEAWDNSYRVLFPIGSAMALVAVYQWSRIRVRGQAQLLRHERDDDQRERPSFNPMSIVRLLVRDRSYATYMACQFAMGTGNLMLAPILVILLKDHFGFSYLNSILVTSSIPLLVILPVMPFWARVVDRMHIVRFRAYHTWIFVSSMVVFLNAAYLHIEWMLYIGAGLLGVAYAGGMLAWNLGHMDFAQPEKSAQYMSVHQTLTGLRGLIAPFLAVTLYDRLEAMEPGSGIWVIALCLALCTSGALGFVLHNQVLHRKRPEREKPIEVPPPSRVG